jgi:hypothetical protein
LWAERRTEVLLSLIHGGGGDPLEKVANHTVRSIFRHPELTSTNFLWPGLPTFCPPTRAEFARCSGLEPEIGLRN